MQEIEQSILSNVGNRLTKELAWGLIMSIQKELAVMRQREMADKGAVFCPDADDPATTEQPQA